MCYGWQSRYWLGCSHSPNETYPNLTVLTAICREDYFMFCKATKCRCTRLRLQLRGTAMWPTRRSGARLCAWVGLAGRNQERANGLDGGLLNGGVLANFMGSDTNCHFARKAQLTIYQQFTEMCQGVWNGTDSERTDSQ